MGLICVTSGIFRFTFTTLIPFSHITCVLRDTPISIHINTNRHSSISHCLCFSFFFTKNFSIKTFTNLTFSPPKPKSNHSLSLRWF
ncbi:hypothetical protein QVD17_13301 [Tagetes erecta]|uniref:Uncharacterized protein n=1 Tax=Tagetes erecta TaxID=13708 RepID=A0AAD8KVW5_TARER|nr:hypothetical protein QVD17_13301 [Tagetes erecta]